MARLIDSWDEDMKFLEQKARDQAVRQQIRDTLHPQAGQIVEHLATDYPWLQPEVVASMARAGVDPSSPAVTAVARMAFQQRVQQSDWSEPGDPVRPKFQPDPLDVVVPVEPGTLPQVAPAAGSQAAVEAELNPTPSPVEPPSAAGS